MKYYYVIVFVLLFLSTYEANAQENFSWPIKGEDVGKDIIYKPQDFIGQESNFAELFIAAKENSDVIAPESGIIKSISYVYFHTLTYMSGYGFKYNDSIEVTEYDEAYRKLLGEESKLNPDYFSYGLGIKVKGGEMYYISGLRPVKYFKTGSKINKGDIIGKVGYSYHRIKQASIKFSRSIRGKPVDPMSVFGIKSTFIPPQKSVRNYLTFKHPVEKTIEDFNVFKEALEQGHPGIYDYISKDQLDKHFDNVEAKLIKPMTSEEFRLLLLPIIKEIRDSHTSLTSNRYKTSDGSLPPILYGLKNDSLIVFSSLAEHQDFVGKSIIEIDGEKIIDIIPKVKQLSNGNDGYITTLEERSLLLYFWGFYSSLYQKNSGDEIELKFSDGNKHNFKYAQRKYEEYIPQFQKRSTDKFSLSMFNNQTAILDLNTFELLEKEIDSISGFMKSISDSSVQNLIIDVRNNPGGSPEIIDKIYSFIANKSFRTTSSQKVNSNTTYPFLKNSLNYIPKAVLYANYKKVEGKEGFYLDKDYFAQVEPDKNIHFSGNVYVLVNAYSRSAATIFPSLVYKQQTGTIVGRETGSSYYQLNALNFANVFLSNTSLELRVPLVKMVFDESVNENIPWGRGVIPDYNVEIDFNEFLSSEDPILGKALAVINELEIIKAEESRRQTIIYALLIIGVIISIGFLFFIKYKRK